MLNVGDILVQKFGYNCILVSFYKVLSVTKTGKSIKVVKIGQKLVSDEDGYGQIGYVMPNEDEIDEKPFTRRIVKSEYSGDCIKVNEYSYAYLWDGNKVYFNSCD